MAFLNWSEKVVSERAVYGPYDITVVHSEGFPFRIKKDGVSVKIDEGYPTIEVAKKEAEKALLDDMGESEIFYLDESDGFPYSIVYVQDSQEADVHDSICDEVEKRFERRGISAHVFWRHSILHCTIIRVD